MKINLIGIELFGQLVHNFFIICLWSTRINQTTITSPLSYPALPREIIGLIDPRIA